jgi:hypothetical protein
MLLTYIPQILAIFPQIDFFYVKNNQILNITYYAGNALGWKLTERYGSRAIRVGGCGMDMIWATIYNFNMTMARLENKVGDHSDNFFKDNYSETIIFKTLTRPRCLFYKNLILIFTKILFLQGRTPKPPALSM